MSNRRILIIEDDQTLAELLQLNLREKGFECIHASNGETGLQQALEGSFDLVILDRNLPKLEGLDVCARIREQDALVPILMLTARTEEIDRVSGLMTGADDYVDKPFRLAELLARIYALLRRNEAAQSTSRPVENSRTSIHGALSIDRSACRVAIDGQEVALTMREYELLIYLASSPGRVFSRDQILQDVWETCTDNYNTSLYTIVKRLRKKIEPDPANPIYIETVRGLGYRFASDPS